MAELTFQDSEIKQCVYCAEVIQAKARKCRYCGEFLNTRQARDLEAGLEAEDDEEADEFLFDGRPSLLGLAGTALKAVLFLAIAYCLMRYPIEVSVIKFLNLQLTDQQLLTAAHYRFGIGLALAILIILILTLKTIRLKMIHYEVTADRIEWSRGILNRRVDNLDMFRVVDLSMRRTLLDCLFGIGTVTLITSDKSDPEFKFEKVRGVRELYDSIKEASLEADQDRGVIHIE
ncbi:PH domain-containing protein [Planctomycetota bacterium]